MKALVDEAETFAPAWRVPFLVLVSFLLVLQSPALPDIEVQDFGGASGVVAKFAGKDVNVALDTRWPGSYLVGSAAQAGKLEVGGQEFATVAFGPTQRVMVPRRERPSETLVPDDGDRWSMAPSGLDRG